jgi:serine/threonine protein kinase
VHPVWKTVSEESKDLIFKLLHKNPKQRMTIDQVLEHPWITESNKSFRELRRKSADCGDRLMKFVAYSNTNLDSIRQHSPRAADSLLLMAEQKDGVEKKSA